ncbi:MAG: hypothetical protein ABL888_01725 [Pirellulaceae bacterium]
MIGDLILGNRDENTPLLAEFGTKNQRPGVYANRWFPVPYRPLRIEPAVNRIKLFPRISSVNRWLTFWKKSNNSGSLLLDCTWRCCSRRVVRTFAGSGPEGLRKIGLLINHPVKNAIGFGGSESRSDTSVVVRSQQYFRSIEAVVLEFERKTNVDSLGLYAKWFDRHARDIDEMSVVNVDPEMVKFGQSASDSFRQIATELRAADLNSTEGKATYSNYGYRCGRYGCYYYGNVVRELEVARGLKKARDILAEISKEAGQVRKEMSQKYGIDF